MSCFEHNTTYFWSEGKANLHDCLRISFQAARSQNISKIVIFTGIGQGVRAAVDEFLVQEHYAHISIIAVTFPHGHPHPQDISVEDLNWMKEHGIPLVRAHLPFDPIRAQYQGHGILGQDFSLIGNVVSIFGGGMSLAIQAILMACDAGLVSKGEHVISLTADTSILARSAPSSHLLTDFIVREVFCKPVLMDISKKEVLPAPAPKEPTELPQSHPPKLIEG